MADWNTAVDSGSEDLQLLLREIGAALITMPAAGDLEVHTFGSAICIRPSHFHLSAYTNGLLLLWVDWGVGTRDHG